MSTITDGPPVACPWCVQADPGLICQADLGGECPPADLGGQGQPDTTFGTERKD